MVKKRREKKQRKRNFELRQAPPPRNEKEITLTRYKPFLITSILGLILVTACLIAVCIPLKDYQLCFNSGCISNFLSHIEPVIKIATGAITLATIIALKFRSDQTARQIEHENRKTNFSNFLEHKEAFIKLIEKMEDSYNLKFVQKEKTYSEWFPYNTIDNFDITLDRWGSGPKFAIQILKRLLETAEKDHAARMSTSRIVNSMIQDLKHTAYELRIERKYGEPEPLPFENDIAETIKIISEIVNAIAALSSNKERAPHIPWLTYDIYQLFIEAARKKAEFRNSKLSSNGRYMYVFTFGHRVGEGNYNLNIAIPNIKTYTVLSKNIEPSIELREKFEFGSNPNTSDDIANPQANPEPA
ncbi:hypothetical protein QT397_08850 [Microbulbifer sp. MKSA007]|nr:hypothetical protein QT397_08850 [Microbulbifer sp. MKSA007]